jgi:hypothetical protein
VELRADDAGGYLATRAAGEDQGFERSRAEGRACGLQLHEEKGAAADGSRHLGLLVHRRRRHITDAQG